MTSQIGDQNLIDLATNLFGRPPVVWGRYFTSVATTGVVEYRHLRENQALRSSGIRALRTVRQSWRWQSGLTIAGEPRSTRPRVLSSAEHTGARGKFSRRHAT
jgi:hypothetical protein